MWQKFSWKVKVVALIVIVGLAWFGYAQYQKSKQPQQTLQTGTATTGTLVVSVSGSGTISSANSAAVNTNATGVVKKVYVHDNDTVKTGQKIADLTLDLPGQQQASQALSSYKSAQDALAAAQSTQYSLNSAMWAAHEKFMSDAVARNLANEDPTHIQEQSDWLAAESKYITQSAVIAQTQSALNSAWLTYQQSSPTIVAPIAGTIHGLSIVEGSVIPAGTQNSNGTNSSVKVANITTSAQPLVSVNLTEVDVPKVKEGDQATITATSQPDKTYTGKVMSVNIVGVVSSGVTSYPVIIQLDTDAPELLPSMSVQASIITTTKDNVLLVPTSAVSTRNGTSTVRLMQNGKQVVTEVTTGLTTDTETEILSGLKDGDTIVTSAPVTTTTGSAGQTTSIFSALTGRGGGAGGNATFRVGGTGGAARGN